jgi:hypothetical protein
MYFFNPKRNALNFQGPHHIDKMGQIRFQLEINQNSKKKLNFLAELKKIVLYLNMFLIILNVQKDSLLYNWN